jgi:hypothetical protein
MAEIPLCYPSSPLTNEYHKIERTDLNGKMYRIHIHSTSTTPLNHFCENMPSNLPECLRRGPRITLSSVGLNYDLSYSHSLLKTCTEVSAAPKIEFSNGRSHSMLNAAPYLQMLSGGPENAAAESRCRFQSSRVAWEHLEVHQYNVNWSSSNMQSSHTLWAI